MGHEKESLFITLTTVERHAGLILYDLETILNPYAILIKEGVKGCLLYQLAPGSGKGQTLIDNHD
jgi:hypothetical protein